MTTTTLPPTADNEVITANNDLSSAAPFRQMPHNVEAEKALLGAIFANNRAYETVSEYLCPEHFALLAHGKIFEAAKRLIERGQMADATTLHNFFQNDDSLSDIGGPAYLDEITAFAVSVINAGEYGKLVYDLYLKRELINLGEDVVNRAYGGEIDETASIQIETAEQHLYDLATAGNMRADSNPSKTLLSRQSVRQRWRISARVNWPASQPGSAIWIPYWEGFINQTY